VQNIYLCEWRKKKLKLTKLIRQTHIGKNAIEIEIRTLSVLCEDYLMTKENPTQCTANIFAKYDIVFEV